MDGDDEDALLKLALALSLQEAAKPPEATPAEGSETVVAAGEEHASSSAAPTDEGAQAVRCVCVCDPCSKPACEWSRGMTDHVACPLALAQLAR
jgi:hypothetical protein